MRKSLWSPDEDEKLKQYVAQHGCGNWSDVAKHTGLKRCGKSCRLRWINYLRPDLKRGPFVADEIRLIVNLHRELGNSWSKIASYLPGRTDNDVKNFWHSYTRSRRGEQSTSQVESTTNDAENPNTSYDDRQALTNIHDYDNSNSGGCRSSITARHSVNSSSPHDFSDSSIVNNLSFVEQCNGSGKIQNEATSLSMKTNLNPQLNNASLNYNYAASDYQLLLASFGSNGNPNLLQELAAVSDLNLKLLSPPEGLHCMIWDFLNHQHNQAAPQLIGNPPATISDYNQHVIDSNYINAVGHYTGNDADVGLIKDLEHQQIAHFDDLMGANASFQLLQSQDPMDVSRPNQLQRSYLQS